MGTLKAIPLHPHHAVAFYEEEERLIEDVAVFAAEGLNAGEAVVIIATPAHSAGFEAALALLGFDVAAARRDKRLFFEDAKQTLARFMVNGMPDALRFNAVLEEVVGRLGGRKLRAYGEMVNVLWQAGQRLPALRLEEFWCEAVRVHHFSLLCAYLLDGFAAADDTAAFRAVCATHSKVLPVQRTEGIEDDRHLKVIAELEQRARALETEVTHRKALTVQLEVANRRKDEFLAMLAHELRNPLAALSAALALRDKAQTQTAELRRLKESCSRQVKNLTHLVDDLLDVSRFTTGVAELRLRRTRVDLPSVVQNAVQTNRVMLEARKHAFTLTVAPGPLVVDGDPMRLEQLVSNLLHNAAKFTPPGGHIGVRISRDQGLVVIEVTDDGAGIPPEMLPRVFDLFSQVDPSIDRANGGLGIGLTLARRLAELHQGELCVRSEGLGKGTTFTFRMQLSSAPATVAAAEEAAQAPAPRRRVLIIEDNEDIRDSLRELLEDLGHEVQVAANGPDGLAMVLQMQPDVALVDVGLPGFDGYEVARQVRAAAEARNTYLVALTGYGGGDVRRKAEQAGFDRHVVKPLKFEELTGLVQPLSPQIVH